MILQLIGTSKGNRVGKRRDIIVSNERLLSEANKEGLVAKKNNKKINKLNEIVRKKLNILNLKLARNSVQAARDGTRKCERLGSQIEILRSEIVVR